MRNPLREKCTDGARAKAPNEEFHGQSWRRARRPEFPAPTMRPAKPQALALRESLLPTCCCKKKPCPRKPCAAMQRNAMQRDAAPNSAGQTSGHHFCSRSSTAQAAFCIGCKWFSVCCARERVFFAPLLRKTSTSAPPNAANNNSSHWAAQHKTSSSGSESRRRVQRTSEVNELFPVNFSFPQQPPWSPASALASFLYPEAAPRRV